MCKNVRSQCMYCETYSTFSLSDTLDHRRCVITWRQSQPVVGHPTVADIRVCVFLWYQLIVYLCHPKLAVMLATVTFLTPEGCKWCYALNKLSHPAYAAL